MIKKLILKLISKRVRDLEAENKFLWLEIESWKEHVAVLNRVIDKLK